MNGRGRNRRPHVLPLVFGLIDARIGGVDYLDTIGWEELMRLLRGPRLSAMVGCTAQMLMGSRQPARMRQDRQEWSW